MLIKNVEECRRLLMRLDRVFVDEIVNEDILHKIRKLADPKGILERKEVFDPTRIVSDEDYKYLKSIEKKLNSIYKELKKPEFIIEYPRHGILNTGLGFIIAMLNYTILDLYKYYEIIFFNNINLAKKYLNEDVVGKIERDFRGNRSAFDDRYSRYNTVFDVIKPPKLRFFDEDSPTELDFRDVFQKIKKDDIYLGTDYIKVGDNIIKFRDRPDDEEISIFEDVFIGWFDYFSKNIPDSPLVELYKSNVSGLPIIKEDLALVLSTYNEFTYDEIMCKKIEDIVTIFWDSAEEIKDKLLRNNISSTPTYIVNIIWAIYESNRI